MSDLMQQATERQMHCECCGGQDSLGICRLASKSLLCEHCIVVWCEGGTTDPNEIRALSLARQAKLAGEAKGRESK